ncbi:phenylalanyl-tRNA synthetase beta subunit [Sinobacterium caligoides]|uniref:Phenylalanine--tRNA ligase beta subunit n=1 Tax=Sinobacterium caligoides TaxID=933926 RepID=A0A3N2DN47_9GAMM|nr:phenylalanine--tRNA ligase subunit beta [Sinobacterium caligoides]ROS01102.1 phenylalanyl-tRNA synthetase beta subunit [Sinobacterium caligoides]
MKFSEQWLREWVNPAIETQELCDQLTMAGLEIDGFEPAAADFSGVVVGEITACEQHPDADKLRVCQVSDGEASFQVVCGAPNARVGIKIPFAKVKAVLPGDFKIKKAKLRGVESFGMLCSDDELGLAETRSPGIYELPANAPTGADLREYLDLDDNIIEVDLTPNRGDCFSIMGVAREVGVINQVAVTAPVIDDVVETIMDTVEVELSAIEDCPRYVGRVIKGVDLSQSSPLWMQEKLRRAGIRSIDPVVDVTNYVLMELGQPMHAFDLNKLTGDIDVRLSEAGEKITLLDDSEVDLKTGSLVIADAAGPQAIAGIMGGKATAVTSETTDIFLESAFFDNVKIAGRARSYGLHTESSLRFERGVDATGQARAIERATALLLDIVGGQPGPVSEICSEDTLPAVATIVLRKARIAQLLGLEMPDEQIVEIFNRLGFEIETIAEGWKLVAPSYRFDMEIEADLLEEVARIYGYNRLPVHTPAVALPLQPKPEQKLSVSGIRNLLVDHGYQEAITYSFVEPGLLAKIDPAAQPVKLTNPISADMSVMRTTLWPGLLSTAVHNLNRQQPRVRLFEVGQCFVPQADGGLRQDRSLGGLLTGNREPEAWHADASKADFFDLKGDLEAVLSLGDRLDDFEFVRAEHHALHPGQTAAIMLGGKQIGLIGALHPTLAKDLGIDQALYLFEIELEAILAAKLPSFKELSKFPEVRRDLAIIIDQGVASNAILAEMRQAAGENLVDLTLFDVYQGKGIEPHQKSLAIGLTFQHASRTLNDDDINVVIEQVVNTLTEKFGASLR